MIQIYNIDTLDKRFIYSYLFNLSKAITNHMRNIYFLDPLWSKCISIYICGRIFTYQLLGPTAMDCWVIFITETNEFRLLKLVNPRYQNTLKNIISGNIHIDIIIQEKSLSWPWNLQVE